MLVVGHIPVHPCKMQPMREVCVVVNESLRYPQHVEAD